VETPDRLPIVGPVGPPGVVWLAGLGRRTPSLALGAAELAAALVLGEAVPDVLAALGPRRPAAGGARSRGAPAADSG
jgi:glycine oxidase